MKLKYYLRGLGIGIVVTTVILMIVYNVKGTMSDKEVVERAQELGMQYASSEPDTLFPTEPSNPDETSTPQETTTEEPTTEPETTTEEPATTEPETTEPPTEPAVSTLKFTISGGMYSEAVSRLLAENGIIDNAGKFNNFLISNGYSDYIQTGTFEVNSGMGYEEIAKIITKS